MSNTNLLNETHNPALLSWLDSANQADTDFPIQNLPFAVFKRANNNEAFRGGVAIGDQVIDLTALGNSNVFRSLFETFPKIPIGMGQYRRNVYSYRGEIHAEIANYILNYTNIVRVWPILARGHPKFVGEYKQFDLEKLVIN